MPMSMSKSVCVCVYVYVCVWIYVWEHVCLYMHHMLVYGAMVSDGPTTLGLRPPDENLHLEECGEWGQFPYFLQTNTQHLAGGLFRIIFHTS